MGMFDIPTRSELDDAYRTMYELRRDVRAMKKMLKAQDAPSKKSTPKKAEKLEEVS
jgi:hypothetical protein